jgi:hypothetical protein
MQTIESLQKQIGYIPYPQQVSKETQLSLDESTKLVNSYIESVASSDKTKGTQLFQRFYENESELFWKFRVLNE